MPETGKKVDGYGVRGKSAVVNLKQTDSEKDQSPDQSSSEQSA